MASNGNKNSVLTSSEAAQAAAAVSFLSDSLKGTPRQVYNGKASSATHQIKPTRPTSIGYSYTASPTVFYLQNPLDGSLSDTQNRNIPKNYKYNLDRKAVPNSGSTWNNINQSSSSTALAAAASVAKITPSLLVSSNPSPKLVKRPATAGMSSSTSSITYPTLRPDDASSRSQLQNNFNHIKSASNGPNTKLTRKPPPSLLSAQSSIIRHDISDVPYQNKDNISILSPEFDKTSSSSSPKQNLHSFMPTLDQQYQTQDYHKQHLSKSQKFSNFFSQGPSTDEVNNQRFYDTRSSHSTSILPQQISQFSVNDSLMSSTDNIATNQLATSPSLYSSSFNHQSDSFSLLHNENTSSLTNLLNGNGTSNGLFQHSSNTLPQPLVFRTTLRNNDKKGGFGRGRKSKTEFNEDKPWKSHERGNLDVISTEERKRYEGVFAANKGVYIDLDFRLAMIDSESKLKNVSGSNGNISMQNGINENTDFSASAAKCPGIGTNEISLSKFVNTYSSPRERIHGLVVREIWLRSKLDEDTLKKLWSLVLDDRKRRWIRCIASGDKEWLPNDLANEETVDFQPIIDDEDEYEDEELFKNDFTLKNAYTPEKQMGDKESSPSATLNLPADDIIEKEAEGEVTDDAIHENKDMLEHNTAEDKEDAFDNLLPNETASRVDINLLKEQSHDNHGQNPEAQKQLSIQESTTTLKGTSTDIQRNLPSSASKQNDIPLNKNTCYCHLLVIDRDEFDDCTLTCDEFIVGTWLVDQCLYGRKMPKFVPISVWETIGVDWAISSKSAHGGIYSSYLHPHHSHVPGITNVTNIVGMGIEKGKKTGKNAKRRVFKKVIGI